MRRSDGLCGPALVAVLALVGSLMSGWPGLVVAAAGGVPGAVAAANAGPPSDCVAPPGLVAWWRAEGDALDGVGGYHGTLQAGAGFAPGKVGQAFSFDGRGAHVAVPAGNAFVRTGTISVEAWINPAGKVGAYDPIVKQAGSGGSGQDDGFALEFAGGNEIGRAHV